MYFLKSGEQVEEVSSFWGSHLRIVPRPDGFDDGAMDQFAVSDNIPKIPQDLWDRLMSLYVEYADQQLEVHARIVLDVENQDWKVLIPKQEVSQGHVDYDYTQSVDLVTGERLSYPLDLPNHFNIWHTHSHNTMALQNPSNVDDKDELKSPEGYCVISNIDPTQLTYKTCFTVVSNNGRKTVKQDYFFGYGYQYQLEPAIGSSEGNHRFFLGQHDVSSVVEHLTDQKDCKLTRILPFANEVHSVIERYIPPVQNIFPARKVHIRDFERHQVVSLEAKMRELIKLYGEYQIEATLQQIKNQSVVNELNNELF